MYVGDTSHFSATPQKIFYSRIASGNIVRACFKQLKSIFSKSFYFFVVFGREFY